MNSSTLSATGTIQVQTFKVVIIGDKSVGKTSIVRRFVEKSFSHVTEGTIGAQFFSQHITVRSDAALVPQNVKLQIWDTAGEEKFRSLTPMYYKNAAAVALVYDSTNEETFLSIEKWVREIEENRTNQVLVFLVGNKCDQNLEEKVNIKKAMEFAKSIKAVFVQTSAKENIGIDSLF